MLDKNNALNIINQARPTVWMPRISGIFSRSKKLLSVLAIGLAIALVVWFLFGLYQKSAQEKYSAIFHQSLLEEERGDTETALQILHEIHESQFVPSGVKGLASLRYAGLLLNAGSADEALEVYTKIANGRRYDNYLRELSGLLASKILVIKADANGDKLLQKEALKQIKKFESRSKIMKPYFIEQRAIFEMKIGNLEEAYTAFVSIAQSQDGGQGLKLRVADMIKIVIAQGYIAKK